MNTLLLAAALFAISPDEAQLRQLNYDLQVATWKGDEAWMRTHLAPEFVLISTSGKIVNLEHWIGSLKDSGLEPFEPTEVDVRVYGDSAVVSARLLMKTKTSAVDLRYTDVWIKGADGWKYVAAHASRVSAP